MARNTLPWIESLEEYQVELTEEVEDHLIDLYAKHYAHVATTDAVRSMAEAHVARFRQRMKRPPSQTVLRVSARQGTSGDDNRNDNNRERLVQQLTRTLTNWTKQANASDCIVPKVKSHPLFEDVVTVDLLESGSAQKSSSLYNCRVPHPNLYPRLFAKDDNQYTTSRKAQGWPLTHRVVLVDRYCGEAVLRGAHVFVKGILAAEPGIGDQESVAVYAHVGKESVPTRGMVLSQTNYTGHCVFLGLGRTCCDRAQFFSQSTGVGVELSVRPWERAGPVLPPLHDLLGEQQCHLYAQNLPSLVVGHVLDPTENDCIYDMCGAPGGKTSHLASLTRNKAVIVMSDKSRSKVVTCRSLFEELGCGDCIYPIALDATKSVLLDATDTGLNVRQLLAEAKPSEKDGLLEISGFPPESFDKILLDPPCSALGLRPKLGVAQSKAKDLVSFANYQKRFLRQAVTLLRPGGIMTFSTCTIHPMENEANVRFLLDEFPDTIELLPIPFEIGSPGLSGYGWSSEECEFVRRFDSFVSTNDNDPDEDVMGFFIAKFRKKG